MSSGISRQAIRLKTRSSTTVVVGNGETVARCTRLPEELPEELLCGEPRSAGKGEALTGTRNNTLEIVAAQMTFLLLRRNTWDCVPILRNRRAESRTECITTGFYRFGTDLAAAPSNLIASQM